MGLFWSLQPLAGQKLGTYYRYADITQPEQLLLTVHEGHLNADDLLNDKPIAEVTIRRHFVADDVERIHIRHGRIRGILYKPKGTFGPEKISWYSATMNFFFSTFLKSSFLNWSKVNQPSKLEVKQAILNTISRGGKTQVTWITVSHRVCVHALDHTTDLL